MKLARTCVAAALLGVATLPLTAAVSWADGQDDAPSPAVTEPAEQPTAEPAPEERTQAPAATVAPSEAPGQVSQRPVGAPDTGGGPVERGIDPAALGGAAAVVVVAGGGTMLVLRRRRAGEN